MNRAGGIGLWIGLALAITGLSIASPQIGVNGWMIVVPALLVWASFAWRVTIGGVKFRFLGADAKIHKWPHHVLADIVVFVGVLCSKIWKKIGRARNAKQAEQYSARLNKPTATRNLDIIKTHPRILRRKTEIVLGYDSRKRPVVVDLAGKHTLIAASTGGGKTNALRGILIQMLSKPRSQRPEIYIIDLKENVEDALYKFSSAFEYVCEEDEAIRLLQRLVRLMNLRNREVAGGPILLIVDEIADLTSSTTDRELRKSAEVCLTLLARKARSANISMIVTTQHPRFDVLKKEIANNLLRKIMFAVDTSQQADVILGFKPSRSLPVKPGEFLLKDGLGLKSGRTLLVQPGEIDTVIAMQFSDAKDNRYRLWIEISKNRAVGDTVKGTSKMYHEHKETETWGQSFIRAAYKRFVAAGILEDITGKGQSRRLKMTTMNGLGVLSRYIGDGKWPGAL